MNHHAHWLTIGEAADVMGVSVDSLRRWSNAGTMPVARTPSGHRRYLKADVLAFASPRGRESRTVVAENESLRLENVRLRAENARLRARRMS